MKKIRIFLFVVIGLLALTSCSLNQTRYPKNTGNDNPIEGVAQYTITLKDYESKEVLGQVTKNEGNHVSEKEFDYVCPEGYEFSIVNEEGQEVDLYVLASDTTVYLKTTVKTYTLCFMENGVKVSSTEVQYGSPIVLPEAKLVPTGYEFAGWYVSEDDGAALYEGTTMPAHAVTLYAKYNKKPFKISFVTGLEALEEYEEDALYNAGERLGSYVPEALQSAIDGLEKYTLLGWYKDEQLTEKFTEIAMPSHDITLYAKWSYAGITFRDGEQIISVATGTEGQEVNAPTAPAKVGYNFVGWYLDGEGTQPASFPLTISSVEQNVYAIYTPSNNIKYVVEYYTESLTGSFTKQETVELKGVTGTQVVAEQKVYTGFTFDEENALNVLSGQIQANGSLVLKVYYSRNSYTISYANCDKAQESYKYGTSVTAPTAPTKVGYTFAGFEETVPSIMPASDVTLTAKWTINQYTITFDSQGGSSVTPITQNYGTAVTAPANPTKTGYTFNGWNQAIPATMPAESITLTASWTINQYTITFDSQGGSSVAPITQDYGTAITAPTNPTKTGYTFGGWSPALPSTMPAESITLTASWTINQYTITFDTQGGSTIAAITQYYGSEVTAPANPTKNGYDFVAWDKEIPTTMPAEDLTITASWSLHTYTITYHLPEGASNNGSNLGSYNITTSRSLYGPFYTGYQFDGWFDNEECSGTSISSIPLGSYGDKELWAKFHINSYTLGFNSNGGTPVESITQEYGTTVVAPADPTREGYTFAGWSPALPTTMPGGNYSYTAQWTPIEYTITYHINCGTNDAANPAAYTIETTTITLADPTSEGDTFEGWYSNDSYSGTKVTEIAQGSTGNIDLYAKFTYGKRTITFDTVEGSTVDDILLYPGEAIELPADPTKEGYEFVCWTLDGEEFEETTMGYENLELVASWYKLSTISYNLDGGTNASSNVGTYKPATSASLTLAAPTKEGYTFIGWYDNDSYSGAPVTTLDLSVEADYEVYALFFEGEWEKKTITLDFTSSTYGISTATETSTGFTYAGISYATQNVKAYTGSNNYLMLASGNKNAVSSISNITELGVIICVSFVTTNQASTAAEYHIGILESAENVAYNNNKVLTGQGTGIAYSTKGGFFNISSTNTAKNGQLSNVTITYFQEIVVLTDTEKVALDKAALEVQDTASEDFVLPTAGEYGSIITWTSNNAAIAIDGSNATVTRGATDATVTLTATITSGSTVDTKEFTVTVPKIVTLSDTDFVTKTYAEIEELMPSTNNATTSQEYYVIGQIISINGNNVYIVNEDEESLHIYKLLNFDGTINYADMENKPQVGDCVVLKGKVQNFNNSPEVVNAWIMQINDTVCDYTDEEKANKELNKIELEDSYDEDFTLPEIANVTWSSDNAAIAISGNDATVTRPASGEDDAQVTLTATYTINGHSFTKDFNVVVTAEGSATKVEKSIVALTFPDDNNKNNHKGDYVSTWTANIGKYSWSISNFNNNNWSSWTYIRCGSKNADSTATITSEIMENAITKVELTIDSITATNVTSISLKVINSVGTLLETISLEKLEKGIKEFAITKSTENCKYEIEFVCKKSSNGIIQVSKVEYFAMVEDVPTHTVTFETNGGSSVPSQECEEGSVIEMPEDPTKSGYSFEGWYEDEQLTQKVTEMIMPNHDVTLYANWEESETPSEKVKKWVLVTDSSDLEAGDVIIILNSEENVAMSTTQNSNNRGQVSVTTSNHEILNSNLPSTVQQITLETGSVTGTFAFNVDSGYLYAASSGSNYLKTQSSKDANASWSISISSGSTSIVAQGSNTRNVLQHNSGSSLFSCYGSASQKAVVIYKLVEVDA